MRLRYPWSASERPTEEGGEMPVEGHAGCMPDQLGRRRNGCRVQDKAGDDRNARSRIGRPRGARMAQGQNEQSV